MDHHEGAIEQLMEKLDTNGDGLIQPVELRNGLEAAGLSISDDALLKLTRTYGDKAGNLETASLLHLLSAVKDHKFHSFEDPDDAECEAPPPAAPHYVFSDIGHFEGAIDLARDRRAGVSRRSTRAARDGRREPLGTGHVLVRPSGGPVAAPPRGVTWIFREPGRGANAGRHAEIPRARSRRRRGASRG